jgi:predicted PurR-regulated permease PerM
MGIFLGPLLISCVITFLEIYKQHSKTQNMERPKDIREGINGKVKS